jgi:hypothetical protein
MATVNKDFKIKSGLVVEGLQGTINGEVILTENAGDQYILDLIGGETLIKSVDTDDFTVTAGLLTVAAGSDIARSGDITNAIDALTTDVIEEGINNQYFTTARVDSHLSGGAGIDYQAGTISVALGTGITLEQNDFVAIDRNTVDNWYDANGAASAAQAAAELTASGDATTKANAAEQNAKDYADDLINDASNLSTEVWSAYKTNTEIGLAQAAAELHADNAIAALVDSAPATLDTLNELAQALQDNPDIISDLQDIAAGKQDTLTAGANIDITGATISVTGLDAADISDFNTAALAATAAAYDMYGAASAAQEAAEDYADGLAINYDAAGSASTAQTNAESFATNAINDLDTDAIEEGTINQYFLDSRAKASAADLILGASLTNIAITGNSTTGLIITAENGVADSDTDDLTEGTTNLYFTDVRAVDALEAVVPNFTAVELNSVAKQVAATLSAPTAGIQVAHAFAKADYRSAEYLVKVAYGTHTEISKVLLTLDSSDNIAITEYGIVGTNGSASSISAGISGTNVQLQVTTANNNSTVTVMGTLLK